jgi:NarL family two-component system response regulator LiaR
MAEQERIRVLIVDDHQVVRRGLRTFLELQDDIEVAGEAGDGQAGVEEAERLGPDVVLMDIVMPRLDGIEATRRIKERAPGTGVIALTSFAGDDQVLPALEAGASSYLLKDVSPEELVEAIRAVHRGEPRLHPDALRKVMEAAMGPRTGEAGRAAASPPADLTERELEVVVLVAQGLSNREIAESFVISEKTVKTHIGHVLAKLELKGRTQLAIYAIRHGLAGDDPVLGCDQVDTPRGQRVP